jgi:hypothetical protein
VKRWENYENKYEKSSDISISSTVYYFREYMVLEVNRESWKNREDVHKMWGYFAGKKHKIQDKLGATEIKQDS